MAALVPAAAHGASTHGLSVTGGNTCWTDKYVHYVNPKPPYPTSGLWVIPEDTPAAACGYQDTEVLFLLEHLHWEPLPQQPVLTVEATPGIELKSVRVKDQFGELANCPLSGSSGTCAVRPFGVPTEIPGAYVRFTVSPGYTAATATLRLGFTSELADPFPDDNTGEAILTVPAKGAGPRVRIEKDTPRPDPRCSIETFSIISPGRILDSAVVVTYRRRAGSRPKTLRPRLRDYTDYKGTTSVAKALTWACGRTLSARVDIRLTGTNITPGRWTFEGRGRRWVTTRKVVPRYL
ncbi:MAG: hypothetical protein AB7I08_08630 [Thermoleophilia bacterium]